jgi:TonB dependent receptor
MDRYQGKAMATYLLDGLGQHVLKAGLDVEYIGLDSTRAVPGRAAISERVFGNGWSVTGNFAYLTGPDEALLLDLVRSRTSSLLAGGFLQDSWAIMDGLTLNAGLRFDTQQLYGGDGRLGLTLPNQLSPRVGVIYDFTREGRSKLYANFARYDEAVPLNLMDRGFGAEYEVFPSARVGLSYTHRQMGDVIEDMSRDEGTTYFLGNPGRGIAQDLPRARRDYDAVTAFFSKSFADSWFAQASDTWSSLRGNYAGLFRTETGQLDPNANSTFDIVSLLDNTDGPLPGDRTHVVKLFAAKEFLLNARPSSRHPSAWWAAATSRRATS